MSFPRKPHANLREVEWDVPKHEALEHPDKVQAGVLMKRADFLKSWRSRHFVLFSHPPRLVYYIKSTQPKKVINIENAVIKELVLSPNSRIRREDPKFSGFVLVVSKPAPRSFFLGCGDPDVVESWRRAIRRVGRVRVSELGGSFQSSNPRLFNRLVPASPAPSLLQELKAPRRMKVDGVKNSAELLRSLYDGFLLVTFPNVGGVLSATRTESKVMWYETEKGDATHKTTPTTDHGTKGPTPTDSVLLELEFEDPVNSNSVEVTQDNVKLSTSIFVDDVACSFEGTLSLVTFEGQGCVVPVKDTATPEGNQRKKKEALRSKKFIKILADF